MGKCPMLSMYILLMVSSQTCSSLAVRTGSGVGGEGVASDADVVVGGLVERTTCRVWTMCPLRFLSASGHSLVACVCEACP